MSRDMDKVISAIEDELGIDRDGWISISYEIPQTYDERVAAGKRPEYLVFVGEGDDRFKDQQLVAIFNGLKYGWSIFGAGFHGVTHFRELPDDPEADR